MSALLLQAFVGALYAVAIYPMFRDYWGFSGLIANGVTQKERAARETQESHDKYLPGPNTLMTISNERKCRNLKRFCCRKQVPSQIVTVDIAPAKRAAPPKKETKANEVAPEDKPAETKGSEEIK